MSDFDNARKAAELEAQVTGEPAVRVVTTDSGRVSAVTRNPDGTGGTEVLDPGH